MRGFSRFKQTAGASPRPTNVRGGCMENMLPVRKRIRLKDYDYSQPGYYFITICTHKRQNIFGDIVGQGLCSCRLSTAGEIARTELHNLEARYENIKIDKYIIMPNHVHVILRITERREQSPRPTVADVVCAYKSITTNVYNRSLGTSGQALWQPRFHDHVIRDEQDYQRIWEYIDENPARWMHDCYYTK